MVHLNQNHPHITLRVKFKKVGNLQYISHLDLVRTMHKIISRAGLPLWYTEGFNPKPKLIFAAPLSIGTESVTEFVDIKMIDDMPPEECIRRLNANMTEEMQVLDAYYTEVKPTELAWLSYHIEMNTIGASEELAAECNRLLSSESIMIEKKSKPGVEPKLFDIKPLMKSATAVYDADRRAIAIDCVLSADASSFLNPEYVVKALRKYVGVLSSPDITKESWSIMRLAAFRADMTPFV